MYNHILIAHDLSHSADLALRRALQLAAQHRARLTLLHVTSDTNAAALAELQDSLEQGLGQRLSVYGHCQAQVLLRSGTPAETLLQVLEQLDADLLVVGPHQQQRIELFSGTNLARIAHHCRVPLLLACSEDPEPYARALLALDASLCASHALAAGYALLPTCAELQALHIVVRHTPAELSLQTDLIGRLLADEQAKLPPKGPRLSLEVMPGSLAASLDQVIAERQPELLVLGQHGRSALSSTLLGSLPSHYLRQPPCDVLLVK